MKSHTLNGAKGSKVGLIATEDITSLKTVQEEQFEKWAIREEQRKEPEVLTKMSKDRDQMRMSISLFVY